MVFMINSNEIRCECGKLLLKKTHEGYELKCSRCKEVHLLTFEDIVKKYEARDPESRARLEKRKENGRM